MQLAFLNYESRFKPFAQQSGGANLCDTRHIAAVTAACFMLTGRRLSLMYTLMLMAVPTGTAAAAWQAQADCLPPLDMLHSPQTTVACMASGKAWLWEKARQCLW